MAEGSCDWGSRLAGESFYGLFEFLALGRYAVNGVRSSLLLVGPVRLAGHIKPDDEGNVSGKSR